MKPANHRENRRDRRLAHNRNGNRNVVVMMRERDGRTLPSVWRSKSAAFGFIASRALPGTDLMVDEAASWNGTGVYTNGAEEFFSRMRPGQIGHHHHIAGLYLVRHAQESAWREDHRRMDDGRQVNWVATLAMAAATSVDWCGYWQQANTAA